jgi:GntR family transcriptional regulator/MocR family aminotransferase
MGGRVLHIRSFSKTISPALRLGFLVPPPELARQFDPPPSWPRRQR